MLFYGVPPLESLLDPRRRGRLLLLGILFLVLSAAAGAALGYFLKLDLPDVRSLDDYSPPLMARVVAEDGSQVGSFAEQRRTLIGFRDIPEIFLQALIAVEDSKFNQHAGIDYAGILRAAWKDLIHRRAAQGASTLTQQLARNLFLHADKTIRRKLQEAVLAMEIERSYTKEEILRFYCNQVYMGHGRYGLEAASRFYLGKPAKELDLPEAALLAGIIQRPERLSPFKDPARALARRNHVLSRMLREGWITAEQESAARRSPLDATPRAEAVDLAPYFVEEVRRLLQPKYGEAGIYQSGMEIRTTLDPRLQEIANRAVDRGLRELDRRQGWRGVVGRVPPGEDPDHWEPAAWKDEAAAGDVTDGVVTSVARGRAIVRVQGAVGLLGSEDVAWTRRRPDALLKRADVVRVRILEIEGTHDARIALEQEPQAEAALVALSPATGEIKALVGGFDYHRSQFDRAIQARRQTGSAFKPFVYAAALSRGMSLSDRIQDEPTVFVDPTTENPYQPENYGEHYYGLVTLREALEKSANIATVKLLVHLGFDDVMNMARRLGITSDLRPYPSLALGAFEVSLLELTSAYGTFANQGVRVAPHLLREVLAADGAVLERTDPEVEEALSPQIAYLMTRALEGVVSDGTGAAAASLGRPLAGKTGTTDDFTDAWFIGYSPDLVVGVWVGFDTKKSLGSRETGALAALPIWKTFMEEAYDGRPPEDFPVPPGIVRVAVDRHTGLRANPSAGCTALLTEAFAEETEPAVYCSTGEHARLLLPYPLQRYGLDEQGRLAIPGNELDGLLAAEPSVYLGDGGARIETRTESGLVSLPLTRLPETLPEPGLPGGSARELDPESWRGKDGRKARAIVLR